MITERPPPSLSLPHPLIRHHCPISLFLLPPPVCRSIFTESDNCKHLSFPPLTLQPHPSLPSFLPSVTSSHSYFARYSLFFSRFSFHGNEQLSAARLLRWHTCKERGRIQKWEEREGDSKFRIFHRISWTDRQYRGESKRCGRIQSN